MHYDQLQILALCLDTRVGPVTRTVVAACAVRPWIDV